MDFNPCLFNSHNTSHQRRSQTFHHDDGKILVLHKYFASQMGKQHRPEDQLEHRQQNQLEHRAKYANVPLAPEESILARHGSHHHSNHLMAHHRVHSRSHSQHYYNTMFMDHHNHPNNYCNIPNVGPPTIMPTRSRHSPLNDVPPPMHNQVAPLDRITVMQVCNELGDNIDSSPPMPASRNYSVIKTRSGLCKVPFPQMRVMKSSYSDPINRIYIKAGESVLSIGPAAEDRSKFTVRYQEKLVDIPHQLTQSPKIDSHWT